MYVCALGWRVLLCCSATRGELWTSAFSSSRTLSRRVWWRERDHRSGICVCEGEMFGHVMCIRGQRSGEDGETVEERASLVNVVSQKTPAGCFESGHSKHHLTPTLRWATIHECVGSGIPRLMRGRKHENGGHVCVLIVCLRSTAACCIFRLHSDLHLASTCLR